MFGSDFFKIFHFVIEILKLMADIFGNDEDKEGFSNHLSNDRQQIANLAKPSKPTA